MSNVEKEVQGTYTSEKTGRWILSYVNGRSCTGVSPVAQMPNPTLIVPGSGGTAARRRGTTPASIHERSSATGRT